MTTLTSHCVKRGPYLPLGDTEWTCVSHSVELVRIAGEWGTPAKRDEMACPVGDATAIATATGCADCDGKGEIDTGRREHDTGAPITAYCAGCNGTGDAPTPPPARGDNA